MSENKYGEPWKQISTRHGLTVVTASGTTLNVQQRDRAVACVNAMAGIDDPAQLRAENERLKSELAEEEKSYKRLTALHIESVGREEACGHEKALLKEQMHAAFVGCNHLRTERDTLKKRVEELEQTIVDIQVEALNQDDHDACMNIRGICNSLKKGPQ